MVYNLEKEHKKTSLMCKKKEKLAKEIMRLEHNVNVLNERLNVQANAIKHYEQEARNKAIEEFAEAICCKVSDDSLKVMLPDGFRADVVTIDFVNEMVIKIAESMKGEKE